MHAIREPPNIHIREPSLEGANVKPTRAHNPFYIADSDSGQSTSIPDTTPDVPLTEYFTSESNNLELSGVGVFSPATSQPASPTISRVQLISEPEVTSTLSLRDFDLDDGNVHLRRRNKPVTALEPIPQ